MSGPPTMAEELREHLIAQPEILLDDKDVMRALVAANEQAMGKNIVDLRGAAMERLEARLDRMEETHQQVIAAAYENLAGMNLIHRAILRMLDPNDFERFVKDLDGEVAQILRVDCVRLVLESESPEAPTLSDKLDRVLSVVDRGFVDVYLGTSPEQSSRQVFLRQLQEQDKLIYGDTEFWLRSEACIRLDLGPNRLPGLLVMGSEEAGQFMPGQATDLLTFFGGVFERAMRRWLA